MAIDFWSHCPLGAKLHRFLGTLSLDQIEGARERADEWTWQKGASNLDLFERLINGGDPRSEDLKRSLSLQQSKSWTLLQEWLSAEYQAANLSQAARHAINSKEYVERGIMDAHPRFPPSALTEKSVYHYWLSELYCIEFMPSSLLWEQENHIEAVGLLENARRRAADYTACQRLAHSFSISRGMSSSSLEVRYDERPPLRKDVCPWLDQQARGNEAPYYLWDVTQRRTVVVHHMQEVPEYACISHTWGRWRRGGMKAVEGSSWWKVPENRIFDVAKLPDILARCGERLRVRYVWFDLLCIPQEEDKDSQLSALAKQEISRQGLIFRNAAACVAWLSYVENWKAEQAALEWLSLAYLQLSTSPDIQAVEESLALAVHAAEDPLQLLKHPFHNKHLGSEEFVLSDVAQDIFHLNFSRSRRRPERWAQPSAWFSSLWTLQEAYLRPNMIFMNRQWDAIHDAVGNLITLETVSALIETIQGLFQHPEIAGGQPSPGLQSQNAPKRDAMPMGPSQLFNLLTDVQLLGRSHPSRAHILVQGNTRQCTGRRAEAIMSVLGVTDWFSSATASYENELVLGMYPLAFVREAMEKIGPDFFLARKVIGAPSSSPEYFTGSARGSMLPFEALDRKRLRGQKDVKMYPFQAYIPIFHPAVRTWELESSGSFRMRQAGILGSSDPGFAVIAPVTVLLTYQSTPGENINEDRVDLDKWLKSQPKQYQTYAVMISKELGLILQGFLRGTAGSQTLIKVGCFEVWDCDLDDHPPPATDWLQSQPLDWVPNSTVNWVVR
jgi:hypothetical protein